MKFHQMTLTQWNKMHALKGTAYYTISSAVHLKCTLFKHNTCTTFELIIHKRILAYILQLVSMNYSENCPFIIVGLLQATLCHFQFIKEISQVCTNL